MAKTKRRGRAPARGRGVWLNCLRHDLRRLISTPRLYAVLLLSVLFLQSELRPLRAFLRESGLRINLLGLAPYLMGDYIFTLLTGAAALLLLCDAPFYDEAQRYVLLRAGRGAWSFAQASYVLVVCAVYVLAVLALCALLLAPYVYISNDWGEAFEQLVLYGEFENYDIMFELHPDVYTYMSPVAAAGLSCALRVLALSALGLLLFAVNVSLSPRLGFGIASIPLALDFSVAEYLSDEVAYFSPVTLSRLPALDLSGGGFAPQPCYAAALLVALTALLMAICVYRARRRIGR